MKTVKIFVSFLLIVLLLIAYSVAKVLYCGEDFIGTYYKVEIPKGYSLEINGMNANLVDCKDGEYVVDCIDSLCVGKNFIYGISRNRYFLVNTQTRTVLLKCQPIINRQNTKMLTPLEYRNSQSDKIDIIDIVGVILFVCFVCFIINWIRIPKTNNIKSNYPFSD